MKKKNNRFYFTMSILLAAAVIFGGVFSGSRLYDVIAAEEEGTAAPDAEAAASVGEKQEAEASEEISGTGEGEEGGTPYYPEIQQEEALSEQKTYDGENFHVVCIGNSVTQHPYMTQEMSPEGYWLQDWGMAASAREKDYAHLLEQKMAATYGEASLEVYNFTPWEQAEALGEQRSTYLAYLDHLFEGGKGDDTDLVILQLGESCTSYNSLMQDFADLINHIRALAPNAVIGVTGTIIKFDEARNAAVDNIKQMVCQNLSVPYISMSGYNESMWVGEGTVIYNEQGQSTVISLIQRTHPGDAGMQYIADQITNVLTPYLPLAG